MQSCSTYDESKTRLSRIDTTVAHAQLFIPATLLLDSPVPTRHSGLSNGLARGSGLLEFRLIGQRLLRGRDAGHRMCKATLQRSCHALIRAKHVSTVCASFSPETLLKSTDPRTMLSMVRIVHPTVSDCLVGPVRPTVSDCLVGPVQLDHSEHCPCRSLIHEAWICTLKTWSKSFSNALGLRSCDPIDPGRVIRIIV